MITVFTKRGFTGTWDAYLHEWGGAEAHSFTVHTYEELSSLNELNAGPIIFADIERLTNVDRALAADVFRVVSETRPDVPILNNPTETLRRYDLLTALHAKGQNPFRAYRLTDSITPDQFPVFLRYENDHTGATTGLLHDQSELERAIVRVQIRQHDLRELIIVEFVDTSSSTGRFVKFSAYRIGDRTVARAAETSTDWVVKFGIGSKNSESASFALDYVRDNPHEDLLRARFEIGRIGYGRIDYSMLGETLVTWEINTNPTIMSTLSETDPASYPRQECFLSGFDAAFDALTVASIEPRPIALSEVNEALRRDALAAGPASPSAARRFARQHKRWFEPAIRTAEIAAIPFQRRIIDSWTQRQVR